MEPTPSRARIARMCLQQINDWLLIRARCAMQHQADPGTAAIIRDRLALIVAFGYAVVEPPLGPLAVVPRAEARFDAPRWLAQMPDRTAPPAADPPPVVAAPVLPRQLALEGL